MKRHDVLIIGAGLAGLRAALETAPHYDTAILSKVHPVRSHSGAAQGGIGASLGSSEPDTWEEHMFDTVKGSDYLGDQDAIEILVKEASENIYETEHMGAAYSRTDDGKIAQRAFGGHSKPRACFAADWTGHTILQTLYENAVRNKIRVYSEWNVLSLALRGDMCAGVVAMNIATGDIEAFQAKCVIFATGGYGRAFKITSNAHANTGDGLGIVMDAGIPLEDMEFVQFHPTGLYQQGILLSEGARGEGAYLVNDKGERFMKSYAAEKMELAPRDVISRAIQTEINQGRGIKGKAYVHLDLRHIGKEKIMERLPQIYDIALTYLGVDAIKDPVPIQPTAHYSMGGIPVDNNCRVVVDDQNAKKIHGLFAAGECACVSVHGANRLGCNSLLDAVVFGRVAGRSAIAYLQEANPRFEDFPEDTRKGTVDLIESLRGKEGKQNVDRIRRDLQETMTLRCGIYRHADDLTQALEKIKTLQEDYKDVAVPDGGKVFNTAILEAWELGNLLKFSEVIVRGALLRTESRGAHSRTDYPKRDDANWMKHTMALRKKDGSVEFFYKPVRKGITKTYQPQERKY
jgi:succinate dehydrogenase / fumarate reductase flavoprotein subunit